MKISTQPKLVTRQVTINEPVDGTTFKPHKVLIHYGISSRKAVMDMVAEENAPLLREVVKGWGDEKGRGGFTDDNDQPIPFSPEALDQLIDIPYVHIGLIRGYFDAANGGKLGN